MSRVEWGDLESHADLRAFAVREVYLRSWGTGVRRGHVPGRTGLLHIRFRGHMGSLDVLLEGERRWPVLSRVQGQLRSNSTSSVQSNGSD